MQDLTSLVTAIGGLGVAAAGVVDAAKALPIVSVNQLGFWHIRAAMTQLAPDDPAEDAKAALSQKRILETLRANWYNGAALGDQKAIAKSLVKLKLSVGNAKALAEATGVDAGQLAEVAVADSRGDSLTSLQSDVLERFDLGVTAILDAAYQSADQIYRNGSKACATGVSIVLAAIVGKVVPSVDYPMPVLLLMGLLATPLAPVAKDLSTALAGLIGALKPQSK